MKKIISESFRVFLEEVQSELNLTQKEIAVESHVTQPWLSQAIGGRRRMLHNRYLCNLRDGLIRLAGENINLKERIETEFSKVCDSAERPTQSIEALAMIVAADVYEMIVEQCSTWELRRKVVDYLRFSLEKTSNGGGNEL